MTGTARCPGSPIGTRRFRRPSRPVIRRCSGPSRPIATNGGRAGADLQAVADDLPLRHAPEPWPSRARAGSAARRGRLAAALGILLCAVGLAPPSAF